MTRDELLAELVVERYGPRPLPPVIPEPLVRPGLDLAAPPPPRRRGHLVVLDGGTTTNAA
ncbi:MULTISPECIES: hypothetical protein [Micromonospora]|uniref:hypothetical protein n=1 Tax=Micromonospora TaxID=1873 RepID=UPI002415F5C6|nr:hypothetical protein [Micromonospora sp. WMMD718]MDG4749334.1 hypothetical protein [Micromonospora sp. WMMD718]MDG4756076.1 hypothetical protein [Micromonospora sp. WMMD718]